MPAVDGDVLGDPAWKEVAPATGFRQVSPDEGQPATERTEVRIAFDDETLYVGVVCFDRSPEGIIVSDSRRDASLDETDSFQVILDTFHDRQNGFVFGTNPAGIEYDGQVTKEGSGGMTSGGGDFNLNWDAAWEVAAAISEIGWSAEIAIPFRTLRFGKGDVQTWGINFQRNLRRRNETSYWSPLPRQFNLFRLSLAGTLEGVEVPEQRNLKLIPYVLFEDRDAGGSGSDDNSGSDEEIGFDLKYSITPSLTLDATYNTDFAQVEVDELQINLDRFSLFFPEKRPFFLENAGQFSVGVDEEIELFFSRRIGIGPNGEEIPIDGGVRLSGKVGKTNVGFLQMRSQELAGVAPENDFTVARLNRELPNRSSIGAIFTHRSGDGSLGIDDDRSSTYGLDGRWGIGRYGQIRGFVAGTDSPDVVGDEYAFRLGGAYDSEDWSFSANVTEVGAAFDPQVGFLARRDYRKLDGFVLRRIRPKDWLGLHELRPHVSYRGYWNPDGFQETGFLHLDNHWEWPSGFEIHTGVNFTLEGVREPFEISNGVTVPEDTYEHAEGQLILITNEGLPLSFNLRVTVGGFFGGDRVALSPTLRWRVGEAFNTELGWIYNDIDLPGGAFETNLGRLRISYSFTPKLFVQALAQYNDRADVTSVNLRFGWLQQANAGLFVVYNELEDRSLLVRGDPERTVIIKYSRLIDLLH
ncbi:MAG: carbohydrate binding family 9 domain-containing protein [bacterium]|nr:carbohydrate binding family 9 domain-containing protein [bacterium]